MSVLAAAIPSADLSKPIRLPGLDLARGLAILGMVLVNFRLAMGVEAAGDAGLGLLFLALEGRTAAAFVMLAGMGLVLGASRLGLAEARRQAWRRAALLMVLGLLNAAIFPADILHFYACYFALGACWLGGTRRQWRAAALLLPWLFLLALQVWDYERGWDWATLSYADFWQPAGFVRHLLFNGWHPVLPWLAFFLWGMALAKLPLQEARCQRRLLGGGLAVFLLCRGLSAGLSAWLPAWVPLLGLAPLPPAPLYIFSAGGLATALIGACLCWGQVRAGGPLTLRALGRCTLSVYLAHVLLGMGLLEALGWLDGRRTLADVLLAATLFGAAALLACRAWLRWQRQGPLETLMRRLVATT